MSNLELLNWTALVIAGILIGLFAWGCCRASANGDRGQCDDEYAIGLDPGHGDDDD